MRASLLTDKQLRDYKSHLRMMMGLVGIDGLVEVVGLIAEDFGEGIMGSHEIPVDTDWLEIAAALEKCRAEIEEINRRTPPSFQKE